MAFGEHGLEALRAMEGDPSTAPIVEVLSVMSRTLENMRGLISNTAESAFRIIEREQTDPLIEVLVAYCEANRAVALIVDGIAARAVGRIRSVGDGLVRIQHQDGGMSTIRLKDVRGVSETLV
jgi:hypothetical protein